MNQGLIKNRHLLLQANPNRKFVLDILEVGIEAIDPRKTLRKSLQLNGNSLTIKSRDGGQIFREREVRLSAALCLVSIGKASVAMAEEAVKLFGGRVRNCLVVYPQHEEHDQKKYNKMTFLRADHPIPSLHSIEAAKKVLEAVKNASKNDQTIIMLISGGSSALCCMPAPNIDLRDKQIAIELLMKQGASIDELNCIRKHLSSIKGGFLAKAAYPSKMISLVLSDVPGNSLTTIASGPTVGDPSTFQDAMEIVQKYGIKDKIPKAILIRLEQGIKGTISETPKPGNRIFSKSEVFIIGSNETALMAMKSWAEKQEIMVEILTSTMKGEARDVGRYLGTIGRKSSRKSKARLYLMGGETTVTLKGTTGGIGGRNQELVIGALIGFKRAKNVLVASIGTDGIDGNSQNAGGIVDAVTKNIAGEKKLDPNLYLAKNNSSEFLIKTKSIIRTGSTGTNVADIALSYYPVQ